MSFLTKEYLPTNNCHNKYILCLVGSNPLVGDLMVLGAATCYGISNVGIEYFVNHRPLGYLEIPAMFGLYGTTINGILV